MPDYDLSLDPASAKYVPYAGSDLDFISRTVYDPHGRVMMTEDTLGRTHWTGYDGLNRPIQTVVNASRGATDGGLNDPRSPVYSPDPTRSDQDRISRTEYNSDGRVVRTQDPLGHWTLWGYDAEGRQVRVIRNASIPDYNASLDASLSHYRSRPDAGTDEDLTTQTLYDAQGRVRFTEDAGGMTTNYEYDALGRRTRVIVNRVTGVFNPLHPDQDLVSTTRYDLAGRVVETTDARGSRTQYGYDRAGRQVKVIEAAGSAVESTRYTCYDKAGRVLRVIANYRAQGDDPSPDARDSQGNWLFSANQHGPANDQNLTTTFTYDRAGRQVTVTNTVGDSTQNTYFRDGAAASITDPLGIATAYRYDRARRRVLTAAHWVSGAFTDPATWNWDEAQSRWEDGTGTPITFGTANDQNLLTQATYDKGGRMTSRRDPRGALTSYQYDSLDRRIRLTDALAQTWKSHFEEGNGISQTTQVNPLGQAARHTSDKAGRVKRLEYLDESPKLTPDVHYEYDRGGNRVRMREYDGATALRTTVFGHDRRYRLTQVTFDDDGDGIPEQALTYAYDPGGQRTALRLPDGKTVTYHYDSRGRLLQLQDWGGGVTEYRYDGVSRLVAEMRPNGLLTRRLFDPAGRLRLLRHSLGRTLCGSFEYRVDGRGNRIEAVEAVPTALMGGTSYGYSHPAIGYRGGTWGDSAPYKISTDVGASLRLAFGGMSASLTLGTASDGSLVDVYVDGVLYTRLDGYSLTPGETSLPLGLSGEGLHLLEIRGHADKNLASTGYALRFKELVTDLNSPQFEIQTLRYGYDGQSRLVDARYYPGVNTGVEDSLLPRRYQYTYDPGGNRTGETVSLGGVPATTVFTYNALNQITSGGVAYDTAGRMTSDGTNSYNWDRADRLLSMGGISYAYDGLGNRIRQTVSSVVTSYLNDLQPGLVKVLNSESSGGTTRYLHDISGIHSQQTPGGEWVFPIMDALGSVRGVVNPTGEVLEGQHYAPYGSPFGHTGTTQTVFGFTGEITDPNGLLNLRARYYVPELGVFPSLDPVEEGNRYGYVGGDVVNRVDPSGMFNWLAFTIEEQDSLECIAVEGGASNYFQVKAFSDEVKRINLLQSISSPFGDSPIDYQGYLHPGRHLSIPNQLGDNFALMAMRNIHAIGRSGRIKKCPKHVRPPVIPPPAPTNGLGFIEGLSFGSGLGVAAIIGYDVVYNLVTFQRMTFDYSGVGISLNAGFSITPYFGYVLGLSNDAEGPQSFKQFSEDYAGKFEYFTGSASIPLPRLNLGVGASVTSFRSPDFRIQGTLYGATAGVSISPLELGFGTTKSEGRDRVSYVHSCIVDIQTLKADILGGSGFVSHTARSIAAETAEALAAHHNRNCSCATNLNGLIPLLSEDPRNSGFQEWQ